MELILVVFILIAGVFSLFFILTKRKSLPLSAPFLTEISKRYPGEVVLGGYVFKNEHYQIRYARSRGRFYNRDTQIYSESDYEGFILRFSTKIQGSLLLLCNDAPHHSELSSGILKKVDITDDEFSALYTCYASSTNYAEKILCKNVMRLLKEHALSGVSLSVKQRGGRLYITELMADIEQFDTFYRLVTHIAENTIRRM